MLTVPEAARKVGRDPETVRRWIRSGKLRARKIGTQHIIEERDLDNFVSEQDRVAMPVAWQTTWTGEPQPDWVRVIGRSRRSH
jgi:excisionase family DNA binding protein